MSFTPSLRDTDTDLIENALQTRPQTHSVAEFVPGPGIQKLSMAFDIGALRDALAECLAREEYQGDMQDQGFAALPLTQRPGQTEWTANDLSGRYWLRADDRYIEEPREELVEEKNFSEFNPKFAGTYFEHVHAELSRRFPIGRTYSLQGTVQLQFMAQRSRTAVTHSDNNKSWIVVCR